VNDFFAFLNLTKVYITCSPSVSGCTLLFLFSSFFQNKNIGEESSKYWSVINNKSYIFEKYQTIASHVSNLTPQAVLRFFDKYIARSEESHRKKLSVQVFATKFVEKMNEQEEKMSQVTNGDGEMKIIPEGDVVEFKRTMSLYPLPPEVNVEGMRIEIE